MKFSTLLGGAGIFALGAFVGSWWALDRTLDYLADPELRDELLAMADLKASHSHAETADASDSPNS